MADSRTTSADCDTAAAPPTNGSSPGRRTLTSDRAWIAANLISAADLIHRAHRYAVDTVGLTDTIWGTSTALALRHAESSLRRCERTIEQASPRRQLTPMVMAGSLSMAAASFSRGLSWAARLILTALGPAAGPTIAHGLDRRSHADSRAASPPRPPAEATIGGLKTSLSGVIADIEAAQRLVSNVTGAFNDMGATCALPRDGNVGRGTAADAPVRLQPELRLVQVLLTYACGELLSKHEEL